MQNEKASKASLHSKTKTTEKNMKFFSVFSYVGSTHLADSLWFCYGFVFIDFFYIFLLDVKGRLKKRKA